MGDRPPTIQATLNDRTFWFVSSVEAYRAIAGSWPTHDDVVWELGAATGAATKLAAAVAREVYAVEKAPEKLAKLAGLAAQHDNIHLVNADALDPHAPPRESRADWLLIDVGGDAPPWRTMELAERWAAALACSRVVVRNTALATVFASAAPSSRTGTEGTVPPDEAAERDPTLLVQPILDVASREVARRLVDGLAGAGSKARQRLVEGLVCLGSTALRPLARLVNDTAAPLAARRAAAEAVRQIAARVDRDAGRSRRNASAAMEWALGVGEGLGAQLARSERARQPLPPDALLQALGHPDELVQFVARQSLRANGPAAAEQLVKAAAGQSSFVAPTVSALDALADLREASGEQVVRWYLAVGERQSGAWRLAAAALGVSDQKWAGAILSATEGTLPKQALDALRSLVRAAQTKPKGREATRALNRLVGARAPIPLLATGASLSPHPWMRELADAMAESIAEDES